jgi:hypothetical protein
MAVSDKKHRELQARAAVALDILERMVEHFKQGDVTVKGKAFGTWQRAKNLVSDEGRG